MVFLDGNYRLIEPQFHKALMVKIRNMNIISEKVMSDRGAKFNTFQGKNFELKRILVKNKNQFSLGCSIQNFSFILPSDSALWDC